MKIEGCAPVKVHFLAYKLTNYYIICVVGYTSENNYYQGLQVIIPKLKFPFYFSKSLVSVHLHLLFLLYDIFRTWQ